MAKEEEEHKRNEEKQQEREQMNILKKEKPKGYRDRSAHGQWVPYRDKLGKKVFYYNKVTRVSQFDKPPDFDETKFPRDGNGKVIVEKEAIFGLSFYH